MHKVYLGLGSNLGDRMENLRRALAALAPYVTIEEVSSVYDTAPVHILNQPRFLNIAVAGHTSLSSLALLHVLKRIESDLGRTKGERYGPRLIDIDILLYEDELVDTPELTLPHPRIAERAFVLVPLAEIAANLVHPRLQETIGALARRVDTAGVHPVGHLFTPMP